MTYNKTLTIATIEFNYNSFEELYNKTNFDISSYIWEALRESSVKDFSINDVNFALDLPMFCSVKDCNCDITILISTDADDTLNNWLETDVALHKQIIDKIHIFNDELNNILSTIQIPIDNLDNVKFDSKDESFYNKLGTTQPNVLKLSSSFEQNLDDLCWT